jgi:hypothetical protein
MGFDIDVRFTTCYMLLHAFKSSTGGKNQGQILDYIKRLDEYVSGGVVPTLRQWLQLSSTLESGVQVD